MAAGAVIRLLAPQLGNKHDEPPVVAVAEDGSAVVPLLGGHHGGNDLAREIASVVDGFAAITTAGDLKFGIALDAPPEGWMLANPENAKQVMADLVAGTSARLEGEARWLSESDLPLSSDGEVVLAVSSAVVLPPANGLLYHPKNLVLGIGCERGAGGEEALALALEHLALAGLSPASVGLVASIDVKADETAVHHVAKHFGCPGAVLRCGDAGSGNAAPEEPVRHRFRRSGLPWRGRRGCTGRCRRVRRTDRREAQEPPRHLRDCPGAARRSPKRPCRGGRGAN
jgi:cobalt-precorrin 5A hydrolase/precorrin-3B C17-methyltransferase